MRKMLLDVLTVRPEQARGLDDRVEDPDLEPLAAEELGELDVRALAKVVGLRLEAQPEQCDDSLAGVENASRRRAEGATRCCA